MIAIIMFGMALVYGALMTVLEQQADMIILYLLAMLFVGRWFRYAESLVNIDMEEFTSNLLHYTE